MNDQCVVQCVGRNLRRPLRLTLAALVSAACGLAAVAVGPVLAQPQPAAAKLSDAQVLSDFIHYVRIARYDIAQSMGEELVARNIAARDFAKLVEGGDGLERYDQAISTAMRVAALEPTAAKIQSLYNKGRLETARDPEQIANNIKLLSDSVRGRLIGTQRLRVAGEYAVPQLLEALINPNDRILSSEAERVLVALGSQAVIPLGTALMGMPAIGQERVAQVLGKIPYDTSVPFLADVRASTSNDGVREACDRALAQLGATERAQYVPGAYQALAERYYAEMSDVTSFPNEEFQLVWAYDPRTGLFPTALRTQVFHEAMAMRLTERALQIESENADVLALWLSANLKRETETPEGYDNPEYPSTRRDAMYYAVAAGSQADQRVLARAIDTRNTTLARKAIAALAQTAGGAALWATDLGRQPLLEALNYPNRRVQYDAALVLGAAQPKDTFPASERVVPTLAGAIRETQGRYALVLAPDSEAYQRYRGILEKSGYTVLQYGRTVSDVLGPVAESPAIDVVFVANFRNDTAAEQVSQVRGQPKLAATPVLVLTGADGTTDLQLRYQSDVSVAVRPSAASDSEIASTVTTLVDSASGGTISAEESRAYADRSLRVLRDLAISGTSVLKAEDASLPLMAALGDVKGAMRLDVAEVLSRINQKQTQVALADAALSASGAERTALLGKVATSAKLFGNQLEARHVSRIVELAMSANADEATAAAALMGSLNLPNTELLPLITGKK